MAYIGNQPNIGRYEKLDDISSQFDGVTTTFDTRVDGELVRVGSGTNAIISVGGVVQEPRLSFNITNQQITFTEPPLPKDSFFGIVLGDVLNIGIPSSDSVGGNEIKSDSIGTINLQDNILTPSKFQANTVSSSILTSNIRKEILIGDISPAGQQYASFTSIFTSDYDDYRIEVINARPVDSSVFLRLQFGNGSTFNTGASDYRWSVHGVGLTGVNAVSEQEGITTSSCQLCYPQGASNVGGFYDVDLKIMQPLNSTVFTNYVGRSFGNLNTSFGSQYADVIGGFRSSTDAKNSVRIYFSAGDWSEGRVLVYGINYGEL